MIATRAGSTELIELATSLTGDVEHWRERSRGEQAVAGAPAPRGVRRDRARSARAAPTCPRLPRRRSGRAGPCPGRLVRVLPERSEVGLPFEKSHRAIVRRWQLPSSMDGTGYGLGRKLEGGGQVRRATRIVTSSRCWRAWSRTAVRSWVIVAAHGRRRSARRDPVGAELRAVLVAGLEHPVGERDQEVARAEGASPTDQVASVSTPLTSGPVGTRSGPRRRRPRTAAGGRR